VKRTRYRVRRALHAAQHPGTNRGEVPGTSALAPDLLSTELAMKRPHLSFRNVVPAGRHCHPLGLLLVGLILASAWTR